MKKFASPMAMAAALALPVSSFAASDLFFSEYIEGSSNNKALEIVNTTGQTVDLSGYEVQMYFNGKSTAGLTIALQGSLDNGDVYVLAHSSAAPEILAVADQTNGAGWFNGDDAIVLLYGGAAVDSIGQVGTDPGSQWGTGDTSTQNNTLRRQDSTSEGDADLYDVFDPAASWDGFAQDTFDDLGSFTTSVPPLAQLVINEVDADTAGSDSQEFIELFDGGIGNTVLDGFSVVFYNGNGDISYRSIDLTGYQTNADGYFVIGNTEVVQADLTIPNNGLQNGADAVALYSVGADLFPNGTAISLDNLVDAVVYDTNDSDDTGLLALLNAGEPQLNEDGAGNKDGHSSQRCANGAGGVLNTSNFQQNTPTPGAENSCGTVVVSQCGEPATFIHDIQGSGAASPLAGTVQTIEGVVTADFQGENGLKGFFVQEEDADFDADASTSEGIFVYDSGSTVDVNPGDVVRVTGNVVEFKDFTELNQVASVEVCATQANYSRASVQLPVSEVADLEAFEGMAVSLSQTLTVTDNYNLGRYGEIWLSANGRLMNPTNVAAPGDAALAVKAANDRNRILIDDGQTAQNPEVIAYPAPELSAANTLRAGDEVTALNGVMGFAFGSYRIHPTEAPAFVPANLRTATPELPGTGSLKIASFNVLNYFNGDGQGGGFPTSRGADTAVEFERQRAKIINALVAMDADIVGLVEIENDGYGPQSAIADLVSGLTDAGMEYAFVNPGVTRIGTDEIAVGYIYKPATVALVNSAAILDSSVNADFIDTKNRPALAQTFQEKSNGELLTVAVNHLKSKGSDCDGLNDPDMGDGQGNCNLTRTAAAEALVSWLATDPTGSNDPDFLIIGDLNAYAMEDPIKAVENGGYSNVLKALGGENGYSYIFKGEAGHLDHALANASLFEQVTGLAEWHINADEPRVLDYNEEYKSAGQIVNLYNSEPYRASDHDPIIVEFALSSASALVGDFNADGRLNFRDLRLLLRNLHRKPVGEKAQYDLNQDSRINLKDITKWVRLYIKSRKKR